MLPLLCLSHCSICLMSTPLPSLSPVAFPQPLSLPPLLPFQQRLPVKQALNAALNTGMSLAQQSLLYAPSQQHAAQQVAAQQAVAAQLKSSHQALFQPAQFPPTPGGGSSNPFRSQNNSMDQGHRWSDPGRRPSFSQHDWMSTTSTPVSSYSQVSPLFCFHAFDTFSLLFP